MAVSIRSALIDEFGDLYAESKRWAPKERRFEALKMIIRYGFCKVAILHTTALMFSPLIYQDTDAASDLH